LDNVSAHTTGEDPAVTKTARGSLSRRRWWPLRRRAAGAGRPDDDPGKATHRAKFLSRRFLAVYVALVVNALLLGAYLWSAGGATTHVRIEAVNDVYRVYIDGKKQLEARCEQYDSGAVVVKLNTQSPAAALPGPSGLDRLVVTDADSEKVLFSGGASDFRWAPYSGSWNSVTVGDSSWHNYIVDAYFRDTAQGQVAVHSPDQTSGMVYSFRPFRHLDNGLDFVANGKTTKCPITWVREPGWPDFPEVGNAPAPGLELSRVETLKSMLAMTLRPFPYILGAVCAMLVMAIALHAARVEKLLRWIRLPRGYFSAGGFVFVLACAAFGVLFYISHNVNQAMPHVPDELSYVFQAKVFASLHLTVPIPRPKEAFDFFYPSMLVDSGGHWAGIVLLGHPLVLAIGELVGAVWLIPPVLGGLSILLIYRVGRQIHGAQVGVIAALLLAFSPFFQMTASNLMSHNTAVFYLLACLFLITANWKRKSLAYGLAGLFFGLFLNTRPLTAAALVPPFGLLFLSDFFVSRGERMAIIRRSIAFAAAVLVMVGAYYLYSLATTGSLDTGYAANMNLESMVGFGAKNSVARGMLNEQAQLSSLLIVLNGWPLFIGLGLVLLPFMLGSRSRWDFFLLLAAVFAMGVWTAFEASGLMYGPRYWYEAVPFLMLLAARGLTLLQDRVAYWAHLIGGRAGLAGPPVATSGVLTYGLLLVLLGISVHGWMLGKHFDTPQTDYAPRTISELKGFNGANDRLLRQLADMDLHNALILVKSCPNWQCYGMVFWKNDTDFNGDIVYARDIPQMQKALTPYLGRKMYRADYGQGTIEPFEPFPLRLDSPGA